MKIMKSFRQRNAIVAFRKNWGINQQLLAELLCKNRSCIAMFETGRRPIPATVLLQLAKLELQRAGNSAWQPADSLTPAVTHYCGRYTKKLVEEEEKLRLQAATLHKKLKIMTARYHKTMGWLQLTTAFLKNARREDGAFITWKKQEYAAVQTLERCGVPFQQVLKHRIALLEETAELCKKRQALVMEELAVFTAP